MMTVALQEGNAWGYQPYFISAIARRTEEVFKELGLEVSVGSTIVAVRWEHDDEAPRACGCPRRRSYELSLFKDFGQQAVSIRREHPGNDFLYGDVARTRDQPEHIKRDSIRQAVVAMLQPFHEQQGLHAIAATPEVVEGHYITSILHLPRAVLERYPPLGEPLGNGQLAAPAGLIEAVMGLMAGEATQELARREPGRYSERRMLKPTEVALRAARSFMYAPGLAIGAQFKGTDLFDALNMLSSTLYEGHEGMGSLLLVRADNPQVSHSLKFKTPVPLNDPGWARKALQMAFEGVQLVSDGYEISGLGNLSPGYADSSQDAFHIDFLGHYAWRIRRCDGETILSSHYGRPRLPVPVIEAEAFVDIVRRVLPSSTEETADRIWQLFGEAAQQGHGSMLVFAEDAGVETERLADQATPVAPVLLTPELFERVSRIDGSILLDPHAECHAIGVILDGMAVYGCLPSRGSRYNSAVRYVGERTQGRLALVVSDDGHLSIHPHLRPRVSRAAIAARVLELEQAEADNHFDSSNWLNVHRFYLSASECQRVNVALEHIRGLYREMVPPPIWVARRPFAPDPRMDDSYLTD